MFRKHFPRSWYHPGLSVSFTKLLKHVVNSHVSFIGGDHFTLFVVKGNKWKIMDLVKRREEIIGVPAYNKVGILCQLVFLIKIRQFFNRLVGGHDELVFFQVVYPLDHPFHLVLAMLTGRTKKDDYCWNILS